MSRNYKLLKLVTKLYKQFSKLYLSFIKKQIIWLLRTFLTPKKRRNNVNAGFVLPTVAMVALVVVLLTIAILFRSFDRSKNASNVRVNETVINAAAPALERAKAKINQLLTDPRLPRSTPSDFSLSQVIGGNINQFTFGDETQLKLVKEFNSTPNIQDEETSNTAWKYPVDTDNNGKFDSYTLYGIYFRTPTTVRPRSPLEARTQPMDEGVSGTQCQSDVATSADLVGSQGWYKVGTKLKRSIFVYTTTVPITNITGLDNTKYEQFVGNKGFVALEYQQDRERIPLNNNAVLYEDDLEIAPGAGINLNGRVFTNGNLLTRNNVRFYLISSPKSCYFKEENSKISVAGNVINSRVSENASSSANVQVDLFDQSYTNSSSINFDQINDTNKTVATAIYGNTAAYNDAAYITRINRLVQATNSTYPNNADLPDEAQQAINQQLAADRTLSPATVRDQQLTIYFRKRTRRVPYAEIPFGTDALTYIKNSTNYNYSTTLGTSPLQGSGNFLRPVDEWAFPFKPSDGTSASDYGVIATHPNGSYKMYLPATDPAQEVKANKEQKVGDRVLVGNSLPQSWYDTTNSRFVTSSDTGQTISGRQWDIDKDGNNSTVTRQRFSQAYQLDDLGVTDRDQFWEKSAAQNPQGPLDVVGGLRVITGAGIYLPNGYTRSSTQAQFTVASTATTSVWADNMSAGVTTATEGLPNSLTPTDVTSGLPNSLTPYLRIRATAVYHYQDSAYDPKTPTTYQSPIACVSSLYDPTSSTTARNQLGLPDVSLRNTNRNLTGLPNVTTNPGNSNNGVVYSASSLSTTGYEAALQYQTQLKYPNGSYVNLPLRSAWNKVTAATPSPLTLSEQSAVDSAMCALKILDNTIGAPTDTAVPHGAIMETAFLDARQIKAIDKPTNTSSTTYDLDVELRQPLEIRATVIDLDLLRRKAKGSEFLFPNSGIIYATRDDTVPDTSDSSPANVSATDFKLDPSRRPNSIMLINGSDISRNSTYKPEEKGLILATNLPVYIQGPFNLHTQEEFTDNSLKANNDWSGLFYKRQTLNPNFACRPGQFSSCSTGETWRSASVLADSITVLSNNFKLGFREDGDYNLRDNYGNFPVGYDYNNDGNIDTTPSAIDETTINFDINGNGNMTDTSVSTLDETAIGVDLNNNGNKTDTSVPILENNITATVAARLNGFWNNNFVTSRDFTDSNYSAAAAAATAGNPGSSYFNNFVTPIQRRVQFSEYVMEICRKSTVTACKPKDWVVGYDFNNNGNLDDSEVDLNTDLNGDGLKQATVKEKDVKANQLIAASDSSNPNAYTADPVAPNTLSTRFGSGTTAQAAMLAQDHGYPRRVAFLRDTNNHLTLFSRNPVPVGISSTGRVNYYPTSTQNIVGKTYSAYSSSNSSKRPRTQNNTLWFRTTNGTSIPSTLTTATYDPKYPLWIANSLTGTRATEQPLLIPVLQIQYPFIGPIDSSTLDDSSDASSRNSPSNSWMQDATSTETNLVFAQGNTPGRPVETNGGLENFLRYLERWNGANHTASGAFVQFKRSSYATAPWQIFTATYNSVANGYSTSGTIFGYPQGYRQATTVTVGNLGRSPFYTPPNRYWGYDVALLTQLPDLFSQRFTTPATNQPNEFYREVGRDDAWMTTLLCAAQDQSVGGYEVATSASYGSNYKYAISQDQRGTSCP